ncbi:MAG: AI-2E family transporter [Desulfovermiculus sp.]|nr:AI-2E family transporter [Desulfovermiculus sp.]
MNIIVNWFKRTFAEPQLVILLIILAIISGTFMTVGQYLTPVIVSLVLAYLLESVVQALEQRKVPRRLAVYIVFILFLLVFTYLLIGLLPQLTKQIALFVQDLPAMITSWQNELQHLPERYPRFVTQNQINHLTETIANQMTRLGQEILSISLASVKGFINVLIYSILVPIMVFFFIKDKDKILAFFRFLLPQDMGLTHEIWKEVNHKTAKFIQGKLWEIVIVWIGSYLTFMLLGLRFSVLLSFLIGISVIIPYVGATIMTIPVALVAYFQWGLDPQFLYTVIAYLIIQLIDGNLLAPLLMSEIVNLHPVAIIIGILVFGGLWGFWGVFFAIPLATLVHAILKAWPRHSRHEGPPASSSTET